MLAIAVGGLVAAVFVGGTTAAPAETRKCTAGFGAVTLDNVKVPRDAVCTLTGTKVKGTIKVGDGATLIATNVKVIGNVQAKEHLLVRLNGMTTKIGGSVQLVDGGAATLNTIRVKGDVQLFDNSGPQTLTGNRIDGNLQCKENLPLPTGSGNIVKGNAEDDCEGLEI
jgi:hypothetical protein